MSSPRSQWTVDTLKELMDERDRRYTEVGEEKSRAVATALANANEAVKVAEIHAEKWRESANEWRKAMNDKDRNFVTKSVMWGYFVGAIGLAVLLFSLLLKVFAGS